MSNSFFDIGEVVKTQGLKGRLKLVSFLVDPAAVLDRLQEVYLRHRGVETGPHRVVRSEARGGTLFLDLDDVRHVDAAAALIGATVRASSDLLGPLPEGEYYWRDILGITVRDESGRRLGEVSEIFPTGSNDVYVCTGGDREILIPAIDGVVLHMDMGRREMTVRVLEGM